MRLRLLISLSLALLAGLTAHAQTADKFFNSGAQSYISNNIPQALVSVERGLKQYPDNVKLKKLYELLKQQSKQQSQNKKQSQQNQQKQSQQQKSQNGQKKQNQSQQNQQKQQQSQNPSEQKKQENKQQQAQSSAEEKKKQQKSEKAAAAKQMSPQEAKRLLDAQKGDEQFLQMRPQGKPRNAPTEDW